MVVLGGSLRVLCIVCILEPVISRTPILVILPGLLLGNEAQLEVLKRAHSVQSYLLEIPDCLLSLPRQLSDIDVVIPLELG